MHSRAFFRSLLPLLLPPLPPVVAARTCRLRLTSPAQASLSCSWWFPCCCLPLARAHQVLQNLARALQVLQNHLVAAQEKAVPVLGAVGEEAGLNMVCGVVVAWVGDLTEVWALVLVALKAEVEMKMAGVVVVVAAGLVLLVLVVPVGGFANELVFAAALVGVDGPPVGQAMTAAVVVFCGEERTLVRPV